MTVLADYAVADASQKANILGAGWQITGLAATGMTPGCAVVVFVEIPARYRGEQFAIVIPLMNEAAQPVMLPAIAGGELQAIRMQQLATVNPPLLPGVHLPTNMPSRVQYIIQLQNGLPLPPNQLYRWEVEIDGNKRLDWNYWFYVAGPPPGPVIG